MKNPFYTLLFLLLTTMSFAQGIAIQGIARDNTNSAITNTALNYTFSITKNDNTVLYKETQNIKTDNFGVFSHVVSTGNPVINTFVSVNFSLENLKIKVSVNYKSNNIEVYDQPFRYVPYAKYAENGVPTGTIIAFASEEIPRGWMLCDGTTIPAINTALRALLSATKTPDLRGLFLRSTGKQEIWNTTYIGPALGEIQLDANRVHTHTQGSYKTDKQGIHNHANGAFNQILSVTTGNSDTPSGFDRSAGELNLRNFGPLSSSGEHEHNIEGVSGSSGEDDARPINYGVNYIIKL